MKPPQSYLLQIERLQLRCATGDVPACNLAAVSLAERMQMTEAFETARMYTGPEPDISVLGTYGLTSFEIG